MKNFKLIIVLLLSSNLSFGFGIQIDTSKRADLKTHKKSEYSNSLFDSLWTPIDTIATTFGLDIKKHMPKLGSPVHETLTLEALRRAGLNEDIKWIGDERTYVYAHDEILRGLLWNDDPNGYLFPKSKYNPKGFSRWELNGYKWLKEFAQLEYFRLKYAKALDSLPRLTQERFELEGIIQSQSKRARTNLIYDQEQMRLTILNAQIETAKYYIDRYDFGDTRERNAIERLKDEVDFQIDRLSKKLNEQDLKAIPAHKSESLIERTKELKRERKLYMQELKDQRQLDAFKNNIMYASHFGNLQYLHSMGSNSQTRDQVKEKIMAHAKYCWRTATNELTYQMQVTRIDKEKEELKNNNKAAKGFRERFLKTDLLYHTGNPTSLRHRALGSLLHMVQDSYAKGHTVRIHWEEEDAVLSNSGAIRYFQDYSEQGGGVESHAEHDVNEADPDDVLAIAGAEMAVRRSKELVDYFILSCPWESNKNQSEYCPRNGVKDYIDNTVFKLVKADVNGILIEGNTKSLKHNHSGHRETENYENTKTKSHPLLSPESI